jgi:hypothetical protein
MPFTEEALITAIVDLSQCVLSRQSAPAADGERALLGAGCSGRLPSEGRGHRFESCRVRQINQAVRLHQVSASHAWVSGGKREKKRSIPIITPQSGVKSSVPASNYAAARRLTPSTIEMTSAAPCCPNMPSTPKGFMSVKGLS